jgi:glycerol kinase
MTKRYALCLDQGGSSSRAILFDERGVTLALEQETVQTRRSNKTWVEQDGEEIVASLLSVTKRLLKSLSEEQREGLHSCALITQRSSMVCCQKSTGKAISPVLSWQDTRASDWLAEKALDKTAIYKKTGLFPNAHFGASKMRWCLDNMPEVKALANNNDLLFLPLASYLSHSLTGSALFNVDPANASRTLLMNIKSLNWDDDLLALFDVKKEQLPVIAATQSLYGYFNVAGLSLSLQLLNGDQSAAAFYRGMPKGKTAYINLGTGGFVFTPIKALTQAEGLLNSIIYSANLSKNEESYFVLEGTVNGAGSAIDWFNKKYRRNKSFADLEALMNGRDFSCVFLNGIGGLGSPDWIADFPSRFVGKGSDEDRLVAVVDSILFLLKRNLEKMAALGVNIKTIEISGGLSRSAVICQRLSDLTGLVVERSDIHEASARGAAYLLLGGEVWEPLETERFSPLINLPLRARYKHWSRLINKAVAQY